MTQLYTATEYLSIKKKLRNLLIGYFVTLAVCVLVIVAIMITYANEPYGTSLTTPFMIVLIVVCVLFIAYSFVFFNIKYGRLRKYQYFIYFAVYGKNQEEKATVISVNQSVSDAGGFDCYALEILVWSNIENDYVTRLVYFDAEKDVTEIQPNQVYSLKISSNCIIAYKKESL